MDRNKLLLLVIFCSFFPQYSAGQNNKRNEFIMYIEKKFKVQLDSTYIITTHSKNDVYEYLIENNFYSDLDVEKSKKEAKKILETCAWRTNADVFIDSVYSKNSTGELNGVFIDFLGDSLGDYRLTFYKHGNKDSIEIKYNCYGDKEIYRYKKGVKHGIWESINRDGNKSWLTKYDMGKVIDTSYEWYSNGNILAKRYHKNGEIIWEKCFEEDGRTEMECDF